MLEDYQDIIERAGQPDWWDQNGTPRYGPFRPDMVGVYQHTAVFYVTECQRCHRRFDVADAYNWLSRAHRDDEPHYGDPPRHHDGEARCGGETMTGDTVAVKEFWRYTMKTDWERVPELEYRIGEESYWDKAEARK